MSAYLGLGQLKGASSDFENNKGLYFSSNKLRPKKKYKEHKKSI